ncbi:MAG: hypothetical protein M1831_002127 [Alyxoria varia]|nr:MAG: hypothetical protein M1831_002127 [Alyxoria varia]
MYSQNSDSNFQPRRRLSPPNLHRNNLNRKDSLKFQIFEDEEEEQDAEGDADPAFEWDPNSNDWVPSAWGLQYDPEVSQMATSRPEPTTSHTQASSFTTPSQRSDDPFATSSEPRRPLREATDYAIASDFEHETPQDSFLSRLNAATSSNVVAQSREIGGGNAQNERPSPAPEHATPNNSRLPIMEPAINPEPSTPSLRYEYPGGPSHRGTPLTHRRDIDPDHRYTNLFWDEGIGYRGQVPDETDMDLHDENDENAPPVPPLPRNREENQMEVEPQPAENGENEENDENIPLPQDQEEDVMDVDPQPDENDQIAPIAAPEDPEQQRKRTELQPDQDKAQRTDSLRDMNLNEFPEHKEGEATFDITANVEDSSFKPAEESANAQIKPAEGSQTDPQVISPSQTVAVATPESRREEVNTNDSGLLRWIQSTPRLVGLNSGNGTNDSGANNGSNESEDHDNGDNKGSDSENKDHDNDDGLEVPRKSEQVRVSSSQSGTPQISQNKKQQIENGSSVIDSGADTEVRSRATTEGEKQGCRRFSAMVKVGNNSTASEQAEAAEGSTDRLPARLSRLAKDIPATPQPMRLERRRTRQSVARSSSRAEDVSSESVQVNTDIVSGPHQPRDQEDAAESRSIRRKSRVSSTSIAATGSGRTTRSAARRSSGAVSLDTPSSESELAPRGDNRRSSGAASLGASTPESAPSTRSRARQILTVGTATGTPEAYSAPKTRSQAKGNSGEVVPEWQLG